MSSKLAGRCTGTKLNMITGQMKARILLAGLGHPPLVLAPTASVISTSSTDKILVSEADGEWFNADDVVEIYDPGLEDSSGRLTQATISNMSTAGGITTITLTAAFPAWTTSSSKITLPPYAATTNAQKSFCYFTESIVYRWS